MARANAFTHDGRTIGFDLAALQSEYGDATRPESTDRIDRLFRHEYAHLMQKASLAANPWTKTPHWTWRCSTSGRKGLATTTRCRSAGERDGHPSETATEALAVLEPRFVARVVAPACATPARASALTADLSGPLRPQMGRAHGRPPARGGAIRPPGGPACLRPRGPEGVWDLAVQHLPEALGAVLLEGRQASALCGPR